MNVEVLLCQVDIELDPRSLKLRLSWQPADEGGADDDHSERLRHLPVLSELLTEASLPPETSAPLDSTISRREPKVRFPSSAPESCCVNERPEWGIFAHTQRRWAPAAERR